MIKSCPENRFLRSKIIPRGEIVIRNDKNSLCLNSNPLIEVSCQHHDLAVISNSTVHFLTAVSDSEKRFDLFINKQADLTRALDLTIGDKVSVFVEINKDKLPLKSVIRYRGDLPGMTGHYFGVELLVCMYMQ